MKINTPAVLQDAAEWNRRTSPLAFRYRPFIVPPTYGLRSLVPPFPSQVQRSSWNLPMVAHYSQSFRGTGSQLSPTFSQWHLSPSIPVKNFIIVLPLIHSHFHLPPHLVRGDQAAAIAATQGRLCRKGKVVHKSNTSVPCLIPRVVLNFRFLPYQDIRRPTWYRALYLIRTGPVSERSMIYRTHCLTEVEATLLIETQGIPFWEHWEVSELNAPVMISSYDLRKSVKFINFSPSKVFCKRCK